MDQNVNNAFNQTFQVNNLVTDVSFRAFKIFRKPFNKKCLRCIQSINNSFNQAFQINNFATDVCFRTFKISGNKQFNN